ncbi:hypothetical protein BKA70DRAFT_1277545 [Coprinopsis sp. MPI-PUGE-AT-0042]|nr:hypothetical protein BKA70DRAFT_1277545 [Coprinopsis sp. MPI-PUGE-AT-0042]
MSSAKDLLAPPPLDYVHHSNDEGSGSSSDTVIDHEHSRTPSGVSDFSIVVPDAMALTTSPTEYIKPEPHIHPTFSQSTIPPVIPPPEQRKGRTLVLCFDGTGDQFDLDNSNVVQLVSLLQKNEKSQQMVYYQTGVGTYTGSHKVAKPWLSSIIKTLDFMFASSLHGHVMSGYEFLMQNYQAGDKINLFGFSRGAYTARSLAGMIHKVGLLPSDNFEQVPFAYKMYQRTDEVGWELSNDFKRSFSINVTTDFIGVWDTVDSVGMIPKRLPFTTSNTSVRTFRHALSLDERRAKFKANLWNRPAVEGDLGTGQPEVPNSAASTGSEPRERAPQRMMTEDDGPPIQLHLPKPRLRSKDGKPGEGTKSGAHAAPAATPTRPKLRKHDSKEEVLHKWEKQYSSPAVKTDVKEVWFAGCHCDVGGGSVSNKTRHSLARIPLRWMVRECFKANSGILFLSERLTEIGLDPATLYPYVTPRPPMKPLEGQHIRKHPTKEIPIRPHSMLKKKKSEGQPSSSMSAAPAPINFKSEEEEELRDALSPIYDQLKISKHWWIIEALPMPLRYQRGADQWVKRFGPNLAHQRFIPNKTKSGVKVHRSVQLRMEAEYEEEKLRQKGKKYVPKAKLPLQPTWVD